MDFITFIVEVIVEFIFEYTIFGVFRAVPEPRHRTARNIAIACLVSAVVLAVTSAIARQFSQILVIAAILCLLAYIAIAVRLAWAQRTKE